jgi:hypothetical protein
VSGTTSASPHNAVRRIALVTVLAVVVAGSPGLSVASTPTVRRCSQFIVGRANSSAYPNMQLPARGTATGVPCLTLRRIARRLQSGQYPVSAGSFARAPLWGHWFSLRDVRLWQCQGQNRGASGPTYGVRCNNGTARLWWSVG